MRKIPVHEPSLGNEELNYVVDAVKSGWIGSAGGEYLKEFEKKFAKYHRMKHAIATSNGTAALHVALKALGIGKGDEVIVPTLTFVATANAVVYCNAKPVFADSHPEYYNIDPSKIEEVITPKTRAIIPVHLYGHPCDMDWIRDIAEDHDLYIIEDVSQAHGAEYKGKKLGTFGDIACFSFYGNKIITTGEGGICLTNDDKLAEKIRLLINHGKNPIKHFWHDVIGFNYRMTNLQAAIGVAQINKLDKYISKKRKIAKWYEESLKELEEEELIKLYPEMKWAKCVYWLYSILIEDKFDVTRDTIGKNLEEKGIETRPFFYPIHTMPIYKDSKSSNLSVAEEIARKGISLPSGVKLDKEEIEIVSNEIKALHYSKKIS